MVDIDYDNENHGMPVVHCAGCTHTMQHHERVWFLSVQDTKINVPGVKVTAYESPGFCSLECLLAWVGKNIQDEMVECLDDNSWHGGEE